jgi:mycoredoxin
MSDLYTLTPSTIIAYCTAFCPDCRRAREYLKNNKIPYTEVDVNADPKAADFVRQVNNGNRSVPTIIFPDGSMLVEPSTAELEAKFAAG